MKIRNFYLFILLFLAQNLNGVDMAQTKKNYVDCNINFNNNFQKSYITVYINSNSVYSDVGRSMESIRMGDYKTKIMIPLEKVLSENQADKLFNKSFVKAPLQIDNRPYTSFINNLIDITNEKGKIIFWYTYDESCLEKYMLINNILIEKDKEIENFTKNIIATYE